MKKIIVSLLAFTLIALNFSGIINAQSSEQELDQAKLMKQLIGTWEMQSDSDTTWIWELTSDERGKGYLSNANKKVKGKTIYSVSAIVGYTLEKGDITGMKMAWLSDNGALLLAVGEFVAEDKIVWYQYNKKDEAINKREWILESTDRMVSTFKWRTKDVSLEDAKETKSKWIRIKK